jgi:hypothetical protein
MQFVMRVTGFSFITVTSNPSATPTQQEIILKLIRAVIDQTVVPFSEDSPQTL